MNGPASLRVLTWNVRSLRDDVGAVVEVVRRLRPDVLCLQEAPRFLRWRQQLAALARRTDLLVVGGGRTTGGSAMLAALRADVVAAVEWRYSRTPRLHQRGAAGALVRIGPARVPVLVLSTHLGLDAAERRRHAAELVGRLDRETTVPEAPRVVVAGDLNEMPDGPAWERLRASGLRDARAEAPVGGSDTFPAAAPRRRIDAVLVGPRVEVVGAGVPELEPDLLARATDHRPVLADLRLT